MRSVRGWWSGLSRAERFDVSLRWPLYSLIGMEPLFALLLFMSAAEPVGMRLVGFLIVALAHAVVGLLLLRAAVAAYLGGTGPSRRMVALGVGLGAVGVLLSPDWALGLVVMGGALTLVLTPVLWLSAMFGLMVVGAVLVGLLGGGVAGGFSYFYGVGLLAFTCRISVWMLRLVWEIDKSREVSAQLAVAQERLRFARDLHDALGRNLSLVAVQSELAARLAERGDAGASGQMLDVRRIAHESLREMRAVVGGYRATDLGTELAGAQSVLRSAGITCRVIGDGSSLPAATQTALAWVVLEATTNVLRHSNATTCKIELEADQQAVVLRVSNDGVGQASSTEGTGLVGLRERLAGVAGTLTVEMPSGWFVLRAQLPGVA
ncbi:sensor histidine kinase [Kribbella italica]|uniref:Two-component system sensor histidine kinase DesK n=1 Tax=Kribbella italica TaxID=1540520 RepID=A0A7W9MWK4_9ACTN|nr:histidine kinase [Kribbella italica]MBB5838380.1 two-component system sensor histidine kinase DesK [Kribbella italica]